MTYKSNYVYYIYEYDTFVIAKFIIAIKIMLFLSNITMMNLADKYN